MIQAKDHITASREQAEQQVQELMSTLETAEQTQERLAASLAFAQYRTVDDRVYRIISVGYHGNVCYPDSPA